MCFYDLITSARTLSLCDGRQVRRRKSYVLFWCCAESSVDTNSIEVKDGRSRKSNTFYAPGQRGSVRASHFTRVPFSYQFEDR